MVVKNRWKARVHWKSIEVPDTIQIRNNKDGKREIREVCLEKTKHIINELYYAIFVNNWNKHYLGVSADDHTRISYAQADAHKFSRRQRVKTTLGRYLQKNFPEMMHEVEPKAMEEFICKFVALNEPSLDDYVTIVEGKELYNAYYDEYADDSCMTGCGARYTKMYQENPDKCSMLLWDDGDYQGRAMMFHTEEGVTVCDRIYPNSGPHIEKIYAWCRQNDIPNRIGNGYPQARHAEDDENAWPYVEFTSYDAYTIKLKAAENGYVPYTDSFHWGEKDERTGIWTLTNKPEFIFDSECEIFNSTGGGHETIEWTYCGDCEDWVGREARRWLSSKETYLCPTCFHENYEDCRCCDLAFHKEEMNTVIIRQREDLPDREGRYCNTCLEHYTNECVQCNKTVHRGIYDKDTETCMRCRIENRRAETTNQS
jgi:hypothetical protein